VREPWRQRKRKHHVHFDLLRLKKKKTPIGFAETEVRFVRDPIVGTPRGERVVRKYPILTLSMAALVKSVALPKDRRCTREGMLRQRSVKV
jgi:hypothetical protein